MNILICCAGGMSSSLLVQKMRDEVKNRNLVDIKIGACAMNQVNQYLNQADVLLVAPQINFITHELNQEHLETLLILNITNEEYGTLNASKLLDRVLNKEDVVNEHSNDFMSRINKIIRPFASTIAKNKLLGAISRAFTSIMPVTMVGSIFILLEHLPFKVYSHFLETSGLVEIFKNVSSTTTGLISLYLVFFIAYHYVRSYNKHGHPAALIALISFILVTGRENNSYATTYLGSNGIFSAIFIAFVTSRMYLFILRLDRLNLPNNIPNQIARSLTAIIPTFIILSFFTIIVGVMRSTDYQNLHNLLYYSLQDNLSNYLSNNIISYIFFQFTTNILWFFGIHGGNITTSITNPIFISLAYDNFALYSQGAEPIHIITNNFSKCYVAGGVGSMFSLSILMTFFSKSEQYKTLGKIALPTTFFFINEPLLFGIPIIMNPLYFLPLLLITPTLAIITYFAMTSGLIPIPIGLQLPWTTPPIVYGFLQGGIKLALWEIFMSSMAMMMWYPFFKVGDQEAYEKENS